MYLKLFVLLYADDTIVLTESGRENDFLSLTIMVDFLKQSDIYMIRQTEQCFV